MTNPLAAVPLRAARWSATHPWRAILGWIAFVAVAVALATFIPTQQTKDADYRIGESGRASALSAKAGFKDPPTESILITSTHGTLDRAATGRVIADLHQRMATQKGVTDVADPVWNKDGSAVFVDVHLKKSVDDVTALQKQTKAVAKAHPDLRIAETGDVSLNNAINDRVGQDLGSAEGISLPITLILMLLAFGALIAAGIPVLLAASSVAATLGISAPLSHLVHAEPTVTSMIVLIGMAVGVDYSLFYLKREREEREAGRTTLDAVEIAAATSGHSILVSGGAVIASMAGLFLIGGATFNSLASGSIVVVAVAVLGSITVLPALLAKLGRFVDRPRIPLLWRVNRRIGRGGISRRITGPAVRHPLVALVISGTAVVLLAVPALGMKIHDGNLDTLPRSITEVQTMHRLTDAFPSQGTTASVVVAYDASEKQAVDKALDGLARTARGTKAFSDTGTDAVTTSKAGTTAELTLVMPYDESDPRVDSAIRQLRSTLVPHALAGLHVEHAVGGDSAESLDFADRQHDRMPLVIGFVLLLTLLMMGIAFRSGVIALVTTGLNLLSVGVAFGILRLVFQDGWFAGPLDFTSPGFVIDWIPLFVMVVLVGLSMDYQVFVLSRIHELVRRGMPTRQAVARGVSDSAGVVTSAAAVMVSVFSIFATLSMIEMKMMGVALAAAILIDATVIRLVLMPSILVLIGDRVWWPGTPVRPRGERVVDDVVPAREVVGVS